MADLFIAGADVITMDSRTGSDPVRTSIRIRQGSITEMSPDLVAEPGERVVDGTDRLVMPGLVNAHTHSWEALFKGRYDNLPLELWMLFSYPLLGHVGVDPDLISLRSRLFAAESLKAGVTTIVDDVLETPEQDFAQLDAVVDAYDEAGIRANVSGHIINRPFVDTLPFVSDHLTPELLEQARALPVPDARDYLSFSSEAFVRYRGRGQGRISFMVAPSGPQRCTDDLLVGATELARAHNAECHIHVLETKMQAVTGPQMYGTTLVTHLARIGALSPNTTFAHGIWVTEDEIELIAEAGVSVSHNPISNMKLGSGVLPWRAYQEAGVNLALGSDGCSSSDSPRMLDVVKAAALLHKIHGPHYEAWPTVHEVLRAATIGGARSAMLHERTGTVEVGKQADLVVFDLRTLAFTPRSRLDHQVVYSENGSSIEHVIVQGRVVVENGELTTLDESDLMAELTARGGQLRAWHEELERLNSAFIPAFSAVHATAQSRDIGFSRYLT